MIASGTPNQAAKRDSYYRELRQQVLRKGRSRLAKLTSPRILASHLRLRLSSFIGPTTAQADLFTHERMEVVLPDPVSHHLLQYGYFDAPVCFMLLDHIAFGDTVLDVGSHVGFFSILAASLVGAAGTVHAFEPTPRTFAVLRRNARQRASIVANKLALDSTSGRVALKDFGWRFSAWNYIGTPRSGPGDASVTTIDVDSISVDAYCTSRKLNPSFIKIDAENSEERILEGMKGLLVAGHRLGIAVELGSESSASLPTLLAAHGFRMYVYDCFGNSHISTSPSEEASRNQDVLFLRG